MLTNREYSALVEAGKYPEEVHVLLDEPFVNQNGVIQNLLLERFTSVALITSVKGSVRANHFHKTDWHYAHVLTGVVEYYHRPVGSKDKPKHERFVAGEMFFSPPMVEHTMFFPEATTFITFAKNIRDHEHHEEDVVRTQLVAVEADLTSESGWKISFPTTAE